jgi:hypothetical protein
MSTTHARHALAAVSALVLLAGSAVAQDKAAPAKPKPAQPTTPAKPPAAPASPATTPAVSPVPAPATSAQPQDAMGPMNEPLPEDGPYIKLQDIRPYTLRVRINVFRPRVYDENRKAQPEVPFDFERLTMLVPIADRTASANIDIFRATASMRFGDAVIVDGNLNQNATPIAGRPSLLRDRLDGQLFHSGQFYVSMETEQPASVTVAKLALEVPMTSGNVVFDEKAAMNVDWPKGQWPSVALSTFLPQMFIDFGPNIADGTTTAYDMAPIRQLIDQWTNKNPRAVKPVYLAKFLAGEVCKYFQPGSDGYVYNARNFGFEGFRLLGAVEAAKQRRGTDFDMTCLLAAVYRQAGLPCRVVIGYDEGGTQVTTGDPALSSPRKRRARAWVEFALYDEPNKTFNWVPVDVVGLRRASSRPPAITQAWKCFGTQDEFRGLLPISYHFHPPTTVRSYGSPGLWGWLVIPAPPEVAAQGIEFDGFESSRRPDDKKKTR